MEYPACSICPRIARYKCSRCHTPYCSKTCQFADWAKHCKICKITKEDLKVANDAQAAFFAQYLKDAEGWLNEKKSVILKDGLVYKLCQSEKEYLETYTFFAQHQRRGGIVPQLIMSDEKAWTIVTIYAPEYVTFHRMTTDRTPIDKDAVQLALIRGLGRFKKNEFGKDLQANLHNIGFNGRSVMFYENNGELYSFNSKAEMIFQFLQMLRNARGGRMLLGNIKTIEEIEVLLMVDRDVQGGGGGGEGEVLTESEE